MEIEIIGQFSTRIVIRDRYYPLIEVKAEEISNKKPSDAEDFVRYLKTIFMNNNPNLRL
jgi:hypothetical protein